MPYVDVNGRKLYQHKGTKLKLEEVNYKKQLKKVQGRLSGEVGLIIKFLIKYDTEHPKKQIGFFSSIRILMPIIDSLATLEGCDPQEILGMLDGVVAPNMMWNLYRDMFMHNDEFPFGFYSVYVIPTGILMSRSDRNYPNLLDRDKRLLDTARMYRSLLRHVKDLINAANTTDKKMIVEGIEYLDGDDTPQEVQDIIDEITDDTSTFGQRS